MADRILGGRYAIQDKVGIGGMATVYRGLDNVLGRTVAVKTMLPQYAADPSFAARFKQEAQAAAALQSPYIVGVYDWGRDQDTYYIVMEYLRGTDLKSGIRKHGALDCRKVAQIGSQICQALSVAHKHDIIHRDIKPQNIMVQPDGNIKVMDFGIARAKNSHLTADNSVLGTAHYVSPEQTQGKELGPTSDLYSLGIVMYEAACGKVPFDGDDAISVALKQVNEQPLPPSQINPNIDATLEGIILKCMQKNPADRFQTADELRRVLNDYLAGRIVNLGEATSLLAAAPTAQLNRTANGRTQAMARATAKPIQATGRIATVQPGRTQHGASQQQAEPEHTGSGAGKKVGIAAAIIAVLAVIVFAAFSLFGGSEVKKMPNLSGRTQEQALADLKAYGDDFFDVDVEQEYSDTVADGQLISQDPQYNSDVTKGTKVTLTYSKGKEPAKKTTVPSIVEMSKSDAEAALEAAGLKAQYMGTENSDSVETDLVTRQSVDANTSVDEGTTVQYWTSAGKGDVDAGDYAGVDAESAQSNLEKLGFKVTIVDAYSSSQPEGRVISQSPTGKQTKGSTITLKVSLGTMPSTEKPTTNSKAETSNQNSGSSANGNSSTSGGNSNTGTGTSTGANGTDTDSGDTTN